MAFRPKPDMKPGHKVTLVVPAVRQPMLPRISCQACAEIFCTAALPDLCSTPVHIAEYQYSWIK